VRLWLSIPVLALAACSSAPGAGIDGGADDSPLSDATPAPEPPDSLTRWLVGNEADAVILSSGPGLILGGGGADVDAAFEWAGTRVNGGDAVILRASGADGYNDYLFADIGGFDSVETLLLDERALADDPYELWTLDHAELIFIAGGDQWRYLDRWGGTGVQTSLAQAWARKAVVGGTSAGCAILGQHAFSAENGTVYSDEALADPYNEYVTLARDFLAYPPTADVITDTHFAARDRMGRLVTFAARLMADDWTSTPLGLGIDEGTALLVDADGTARVEGAGSVYALRATGPAETCAPGQPLSISNVELYRLGAGDQMALPSGATEVAGSTISASAGTLSPASPY